VGEREGAIAQRVGAVTGMAAAAEAATVAA